MKGNIPTTPNDLDFFLQEITIEDIIMNGVSLYKCNLTIPMMDCEIICISIDISGL